MQGGRGAADEATAGHLLQILTRSIEQQRRNNVLLPVLLLELVQQRSYLLLLRPMLQFKTRPKAGDGLMGVENRYTRLLVMLIKTKFCIINACQLVYIVLDATHQEYYSLAVAEHSLCCAVSSVNMHL